MRPFASHPRFPRLRLAAWSLAGAAAVQVVLIACAHGGVFLDAERDASAQSFPASKPCARWEAKVFLPTTYTNHTIPYTDPSGNTETLTFRLMDTVTLPDGWEPFAGEGALAIIARRCAE